MSNPYQRETLENWVGDFCHQTDALRQASAELRAHTPGVLVAFLDAACAKRSLEPGEVEEEDLAAALLDRVARLDVPDGVRAHVPTLCGELLEFLEREGRLAGGGQLGAYVRALGPRYAELAAGKPKPIRKMASKLGRNDPCPCGSGKKYKKCCQRG